FFLLRDSQVLRTRFFSFGFNAFGNRGELMARHASDAVNGVVIGLILVGIGVGALIGIGYWVAGLHHPFLFTVATAVLAIIPMGAPIAFSTAAVTLYLEGHVIGAAGVFGYGFLILMLADYLVRPLLIGGAARLPFLFVLLSTLGGLST